MVRKKSKIILKANGKFYAFVGIIAAAIVVIVLIINNIQTYTIQAGEIVFEDTYPIVIVRDEQVVEAENYGKANYIVAEGSRVEADSPVAEVFKWGYNEKVGQELLSKQGDIEDYQENSLMQDKQDSNLVTLNTDIEQKAAEIKEMINSGTGDVLAAERELNDLMGQKKTYLNDNVEADSKLEEFFHDEEQLQERVDNSKEVKVSPQAGMVSYYFDGAEQVLNANNLQGITFANIEDVLNGTTVQPEAAEETTQKPLYRLVNNFKWYLLIYSEQPMREFANHNTFQIAFDDYTARQYEGSVVGHVSEEKGYIYVVEVLDDIGELLSTRRTDANIFTKFEGMKVPVESLQEKDGVTGVTVVSGRTKTFVPVTVKIIKDGSAIIEPLEEGSALAVNQKIEV